MNKIRFLTFVLVIGTLVLSACGATASTATPAAESTGQKVEAMPVAFVGIVDSMAGDQWVISGTTVTVDESIVRDGPFNVGDRIKVEGFANPDGSFTVSRVEAPTPQEVATLPPVSVDNSNEAISNANTNDANVNDDSANINDDHGTDVNTNDDHSNSANLNDDHGGNGNSSDDSSTANTNDDNGGSNTNDDKGGNGKSKDDKGSVRNSNDDNGNGG